MGLTLNFEPRSKDVCSELHVSEESDLVELSFQIDGTIQLFINTIGSSHHLVIPETCLLYLIRVERAVGMRKCHSKQLKYSHRNKKRPELIGLTSTEVHNWNQFKYIERLSDISHLPLLSYSDTSADFAFVPKETDMLVVSQNYSLMLFDPDALTLMKWNEYTVKMRFRRPKDPKCSIGNQRPGFSIRELEGDGEVFEVQFEAHQLSEALTLDVLAVCELKLISIGAIINFDSYQYTDIRNHFRCKMTPEIARDTKLTLRNAGLLSRMSRMIKCLEQLSDFPSLFFRPQQKYPDLEMFHTKHIQPSAVPKDVPLLLHSTVKNANFQQDTVTLTFKLTTKRCRIEQSEEKTAGLSIQRHVKSQTIRVIYQSHLLNDQYPLGTDFSIQASCILNFVNATRLIESPVH